MALIRCPECGRRNSNKVNECRFCGLPFGAPKSRFLPTLLGCLSFVIIGPIVVACFVNMGTDAIEQRQETQHKKPRSSVRTMRPSRSVPLSKITWANVNQIYGLKSKKTDLQKDEIWKNYKGKKVQWQGTVVDISENFLSELKLYIKMNRNTFTFDLSITLKETERTKAMILNEGDRVTFQGVLVSWGTLMSTSLEDGILID